MDKPLEIETPAIVILAVAQMKEQLAASSRARAEAEAREAAQFDLFMTIPRRRRVINDSLRSVAVDPRADAYRQACQDIEDEIRANAIRVSPIALALVEMERAARTGDAEAVKAAVANLDRARGSR